MKIGILSDCHLGVYESDEILRRDSFETFAEGLTLLQDCDLILLLGDLFDRPQPSNPVIKECIEILREFYLKRVVDGIEVKAVKGKSTLKPGSPDFIPIIATHGTHDRPVGYPKLTSILAVLSEAGLIEYVDTNPKNDLSCKRIIFEKDVQIQIEAFGHVPEQTISEVYDESYFQPEKGVINILMLHQSLEHYMPGKTGMITLNQLPNVNLVVCGHRHKPEIQDNVLALRGVRDKKIKIAIPGSTTATAISLPESGKKYVHVLKITKDDIRVESKPLTKTRLVLYDKIDIPNATPATFEEPCRKKINELLTDRFRKKPRLRIIIEGTIAEGYTTKDFNTSNLTSGIKDKVFNPEDAIKNNLKTKEQKKLEEKLRRALAASSNIRRAFFKELNNQGYKGIVLSMEELFNEGTTRSEEKFCSLVDEKIKKVEKE